MKRQTAAGGASRAERPDPPVAAKCEWVCRARNASGVILLHGGPYESKAEAEAALAKARRRHPGILRHSWVQEVEERK